MTASTSLEVEALPAAPTASGRTASVNANDSKPLAGILFDIDGTLVNSDPIHFAVFQELLLKEEAFQKKFGLDAPIDEEFFRTWISGRSNSLINADFFPDWSIAKREEWAVRKEALFREKAQSSMKARQMPGLDRLRDWITVNELPKAAVTNAPRLNAEAMLSGIGYDDWFGENLVIGDECERPKPDPCPYLTACKKIGLRDEENASQCIVFEDSPSGAKAGVAAGATVIGIVSGQSKSALLEVGCSFVIDNFEDPQLWDHLKSRTIVTTVPKSG